MKLNRIKAVLVEQDKSQKWLAEQLGKSFSTTNTYCCNRQQPNLDTLVSNSPTAFDKTQRIDCR